MTTAVDAGINPDAANQMIAGALADTSAPAAPAIPAPKILPPPEKSVELIGGVVNQLEGTSETLAVVRELTGSDEEALTSPSLARSVPKYLGALVARGTETIGGKKPTQDQLDNLLIGDRELLLLAIRKATYGIELELLTRCPHCDVKDEDYVLDLDDIPVKAAGSRDEVLYGFEVNLPSGMTALVGLPTAGDQDAIMSAGDKTEGELNTLMLSRAIRQLDGQPLYSPGQVKAMTIRDRRAILKEFNKRTPGPQIGEVKRTCGACEKEFDLNLGLLDLFRA